MSDQELVTTLFVSAVGAEQGLWRERVIKKIKECNPKTQFNLNSSTDIALINILVESAKSGAI